VNVTLDGTIELIF